MKVIITGATGMVGEGVLMECLVHRQVSEVLCVSRKSTSVNHPKLTEYVVADLSSLKDGDEQLKGYDACFFCAGVSAVGMKEPEYTRVTYDMTLAFAQALEPKPQMTFVYVSGAGTSSSENGGLMWARVKGKTENALIKLPFKRVFAFRPGLMKFTRGQKRVSRINKFVSRLYPALKVLFPNIASTLSEVGQAMIQVAQASYEKTVVEVKDIKILADRAKEGAP